MENIRKHTDIQIVTITITKINLVLEKPNYHTTKCFSQNLLAIEMKK